MNQNGTGEAQENAADDVDDDQAGARRDDVRGAGCIVQTSSSAISGGPDFLPTTAGSLC
ncbi:hypothetical protein [Undibacterium luofuense]|uniref:hypothetical protein n=1 Tax=Undibacterium luofuense TaxID=2828733 RepID=UPI0030EF7E16